MATTYQVGWEHSGVGLITTSRHHVWPLGRALLVRAPWSPPQLLGHLRSPSPPRGGVQRSLGLAIWREAGGHAQPTCRCDKKNVGRTESLLISIIFPKRRGDKKNVWETSGRHFYTMKSSFLRF